MEFVECFEEIDLCKYFIVLGDAGDESLHNFISHRKKEVEYEQLKNLSR